MIPAAIPGILYIRFFCNEQDDSRLTKLPIAHYFFIGVYLLQACFQFYKGLMAPGVTALIGAGVNYYFLTVVQRYVKINSTS